jgi:hypothetical protein
MIILYYKNYPLCFKELVRIYMKHIKVMMGENILCKRNYVTQSRGVYTYTWTDIGVSIFVSICIWLSVYIPLHISLLMAICLSLQLSLSYTDVCLSLQLTLSCGSVSEV